MKVSTPIEARRRRNEWYVAAFATFLIFVALVMLDLTGELVNLITIVTMVICFQNANHWSGWENGWRERQRALFDATLTENEDEDEDESHDVRR